MGRGRHTVAGQLPIGAQTLEFQRLRQRRVVTGTALNGALLHLELAPVWLRTASDVWLYRPQYSVTTGGPDRPW